MNLRQLEILRAVIRARTTVAAAHELGMSQPAVSNAIKAMEQRAGFPLFERVNNRLFPTAEAQAIYEDAEPLFRISHSLGEKIDDLRENKAGQIRILATPPVGYGVIPVAIRNFLAERPRVKVFFDIRRFEQVVESVENRIVDLGVALGFDEQPGIESEAVFGAEMVCVCRPEHPLASLDAVRPKDLMQHSFIALQPRSRLGILVRQAFLEDECPFNFAVEVRYCQTACVLAGSGVGAAVVDSFSAALGGAGGLVIRPFFPTIRIKGHAIWLKGRPLSRLVSAFLAEMRKAAAESALPLPAPVQRKAGRAAAR